MRTLTAIILAAILAGASACATTGGGYGHSKGEERYAKYEPYLGEPVDSFTALQKYSWEPISRTQLVLWTTVNDAYLLTITGNCPELSYSEAVGVTSTTSQITKFDSVIVRGNRCPIKQIQPIDVERMKADRNARAAEQSRRLS
jgi:hypothetical protein